MVGWGLVSMAMMFASGVSSFYLLRVLLGVAEAGFFPGVILYLTYWVPAAHRAKTNALFMTAIPVSVIVGAPISEALLKLDGALGLRGWQWLFLVEGLPAVLVGIAAFFYLTDSPEKATWLAPDKRAWLTETMARERTERVTKGHGVGAREPAKRQAVAVVRDFHDEHDSDLRPVPVAAAHPARRLEGQRSAHWMADGPAVCRGARGVWSLWDVTRTAPASGSGTSPHVRWWLRPACCWPWAFQDNVWMLVLSFTLSQLGQRSLLSVFWAIPPLFLGGTAAAAGIALINSLGNLGGAVGPTVVGSLRGSSGDYTSGLLVLAAALVIEAILVASMRLPRQHPAVALATAGARP